MSALHMIELTVREAESGKPKIDMTDELIYRLRETILRQLSNMFTGKGGVKSEDVVLKVSTTRPQFSSFDLHIVLASTLVTPEGRWSNTQHCQTITTQAAKLLASDLKVGTTILLTSVIHFSN